MRSQQLKAISPGIVRSAFEGKADVKSRTEGLSTGYQFRSFPRRIGRMENPDKPGSLWLFGDTGGEFKAAQRGPSDEVNRLAWSLPPCGLPASI